MGTCITCKGGGKDGEGDEESDRDSMLHLRAPWGPPCQLGNCPLMLGIEPATLQPPLEGVLFAM